MLKVLRQREMLLLWFSKLVSGIGDHFYDIAVVWIATRQVGEEAGFIVLAGSLSTLAFGTVGGVFADRWNRRQTMFIVDAVRAVVLFALFGLAATATLQLWHLAIVTAITIGLNALFLPSMLASLPTVAPTPGELQAANALFDLTERLARTIGPALAGFLLALVPIHSLFLLDGLTFAFSALAIFALGNPARWQPAPSENPQSVLADVRDGIRLLRNHKPLLWGLFLLIFFGNVFWAIQFIIGLPLFAERVLGGNASTLGFIIASYGVGNVIGNMLVGSVTLRRRYLVMFGGQVVLGLGWLLLASTNLRAIAMLGAFIAAFGGPMVDVMLLVIIQSDIPPAAIGKIYSLRMVISEIGLALGLALAAPFYGLFTTPHGIAVCAVIEIALALAGIWRFALPRRKPLPA